jgi:hypothetical protein
LNNPGIINRINLPPNVIEIVDSDITETYELYLMCKAMVGPTRNEIGYVLLAIDLDKF